MDRVHFTLPAFETFIGHTLKGGQGQFFTPRNVVKMIVDILDPGDEDSIIDPACGSGGFLIEALRHVWRKLDAEGKKYRWNNENLKEEKMAFALNKIRGIDKDYVLAKVAKAYMAIVGDGKSGIVCDDSLEQPQYWRTRTKEKIDMGKFSIVVTNPPFGAKIPVRGEEKLKQFALGYKWKFDKKSGRWIKTAMLKAQEEPQVLFIERCFALLKEGGKMAMVLPNGVLGNEQKAYLRQYIQAKGHVFAIVALPLETFSPYVTINTSVLFIQKGKGDKKDIFISINKYCGHDKKGKPVAKDDLPRVASFYKKGASNENNFFIKQRLLGTNFMAKRYLKKHFRTLEEMSNLKYPVKDFGEIITSIHNGANLKNASFYVDKEEGMPYILVRSITKEGINFENLKYIKKSLAKDKSIIKNRVDEDSVLITRAGNAGIAANIPPDLVGGVASGFLLHIKVVKSVNPYYVVAFLNSRLGQVQLERIASGSILKSIRATGLKRIKIVLPPKAIQDDIGNKIKESVYACFTLRKKIREADAGVLQLCS